jgi:hypothetical protein
MVAQRFGNYVERGELASNWLASANSSHFVNDINSAYCVRSSAEDMHGMVKMRLRH